MHARQLTNTPSSPLPPNARKTAYQYAVLPAPSSAPQLTMLMSDSIGGTAKTLMFVNVSPVDANLDETQNSLQYAQRVSTIRNDVSKNENSVELLKLRKQVGAW